MAVPYTITIKNNTGVPQDYSVFAAPPIVSGGASGDVWSNVVAFSPKVPAKGQMRVRIQTNYYAICGSYATPAEQGVQVSVSKNLPVSLGVKRVGTGQVKMGTTVPVKVIAQSSCDFEPPLATGGGKLGNFMFTTSTDFTNADALDNNIFIGVAYGEDRDNATAMGTFTPRPNMVYQIAPQNIFHVASGEQLRNGTLVKAERVDDSIAVDFSIRGTNDVILAQNGVNQWDFV